MRLLRWARAWVVGSRCSAEIYDTNVVWNCVRSDQHPGSHENYFGTRWR